MYAHTHKEGESRAKANVKQPDALKQNDTTTLILSSPSGVNEYTVNDPRSQIRLYLQGTAQTRLILLKSLP